MNKKRLAIGAVGFSLMLMAFGPHGSFKPTEVGFYTAIGAGIMFYFLTQWLFTFVKKGEKKG